MSYFVRIRGNAFGPFDENQLQNMKTQGKLGRTTEVSENRTDWKPAGSLSWLFPPAPLPDPLPSGRQSASTAPADSATYGAQAEPAEWYFSVNGTEGYGPVTRSAVVQKLQVGELDRESLVWQAGQNAQPIRTVAAFRSTPTPPGPNEQWTDSSSAEKTKATMNVSSNPFAASLGWLMFLKVVFLVGVIGLGLCCLLGSIFVLSQAVGSNRVTIFLVALLNVAFSVAMFVMLFRAFFYFWRYHTDLYQAVASNREDDLAQAHQSLYLFWKWMGINVIVLLALFLLGVIIGVIIAGFGTGWIMG